MRTYVKYIIWLLSIVVALYLFGFFVILAHNKMIPLSNGYECLLGDEYKRVIICLPPKDNPASFARLRSIDDRGLDRPHLGPNVDGYRVYDIVIIGHVAKTEDWDHYNMESSAGREAKAKEVPGYFVINAQSDVVYKGLSKEKWLQKLKTFGIKHEPKLYKPSRLDELLGRNKPVKPE